MAFTFGMGENLGTLGRLAQQDGVFWTCISQILYIRISLHPQ